MAKIAYGKREDIQQAIDNGVIPENTTIITNETEPELLFYDKNKKLKTIDEKSRFYSLIEVSQWLEKYDCGGLFFSVYDKGKWTPYVINHENEMIPFAELYDDTPLKEQIELLIKENESQNIQISEIFKILEEIEQVQTGKQFIFKGSYSETNLAEEIENNPPELGDVYQVLDCNSYGVNYGDLFYATGEIADEEEKEWYESNGEPILSSSSQSIISGYKFIQIANGSELYTQMGDLWSEFDERLVPVEEKTEKISNNEIRIQDSNGDFCAGNIQSKSKGSVTIGNMAQTDDINSVTIGNEATSHNKNSVSIGYGAVASGGNTIAIRGFADGDDSICIGNSYAWGGVVVGNDSVTDTNGVALGNGARTEYYEESEDYWYWHPAIQIGKGNNPNSYTAQLYNYQLLSTDTENASVTSEKWLTDVGKLSDLETNDKTNIVSAINEEVRDRLSECELLWKDLGDVSILETTDKSSVVGAINEINSNKQAEDFVITGTVTGNLGTGGIDVSDISCTYEEARAAFDGGQNVKCLFYVPEMGSYTEFRYKAHSDFMIMFECMWDDYNYLPVFMANDTWDWGYSTPYRGDYVETEAMYNVAPIKVRGTIDSNNTLTLNRAQHYGRIFENAEDIQDRIVLYLNQVPIIFYVFVEEQGRFMNCYMENIIGKRNSVGTTAEVWSYDAMSFSGHIGNTVYHLDCIKVRDDYTGSFAWQWSVYTAELVAKTEIETQIGDINTALETALNGGAS